MSVPSNVVSMYDPQIPVDQSIYEESTTAKTKVGTRLRVGERTYFYAKAATNLTAANIYCAPNHVATRERGATNTAWIVGSGTNLANALTVTMGTDVAANLFAEGYLVTASQALAGGGLMFKIKAHGSIGSGTSGVITLYDNIPVSTVAAQPINFVQNQFSNVILGSQVIDMPVGVAPIAVTASNYCWLQTWGPCPMRHSAASAVAGIISMGTLGQAVVNFDATTNSGLAATSLPIGKNAGLVATATQCNPVFLMLTP